MPLQPDPRFPDRPTHSDFELISNLVRQMDGVADEQVPVEEIVAGTVDFGSLLYLAKGRVRAFTERTNVHFTVSQRNVIAAAYFEAFALGVQFERAGGHRE